MDNVLQNPNITSALNEQGIDDIFGLMILTDDIVDDLVYSDSDPQVQIKHRLKRGEIGLIKSFIHYMYYLEELSNPIGDDCTNITMDNFDKFRSNLSYTRKFGSLSTLFFKSPPSPSSSSSTPSLNQSPLGIKKHGIKCDPSLCPTIKDEKFDDPWHQSFANQAKLQDISDVSDATYEPFTVTSTAIPEEHICLDEKLIPSTDNFSKEQKHMKPHATACTLKELENQVFQNEVKEQEVYHPHDTDIFDITKRDPDYHKLLPFFFSLYPAIIDSSKHCGYACTFNILTSDSATIIDQSLVHPDTTDNYSLCVSMFVGEKAIHNDINNDDNNHNNHPIIKYQYYFTIMNESKPADTLNNDDTPQKTKSNHHSSPMFNPEEFIGLSFLINKQEDGQ